MRLTVRELLDLTLSNDLHPAVKKHLTEIVQLLQTYARLAELEISSMQAAGEKLPIFRAGEVLDIALPSGTKEKVRDFAQAEQEKAKRREEGERVLKEVVALAESRGYDASALRYFSKQ